VHRLGEPVQHPPPKFPGGVANRWKGRWVVDTVAAAAVGTLARSRKEKAAESGICAMGISRAKKHADLHSARHSLTVHCPKLRVQEPWPLPPQRAIPPHSLLRGHHAANPVDHELEGRHCQSGGCGDSTRVWVSGLSRIVLQSTRNTMLARSSGAWCLQALVAVESGLDSTVPPARYTPLKVIGSRSYACTLRWHTDTASAVMGVVGVER
jgi:hypothetical protein